MESKDPQYPVGSLIVSHEGWCDKGKINPAKMPGNPLGGPAVRPATDLKGLPLSHLIGCCGMPGNTAYFGFLELCQPKAGETVVVNGAAGAVGSLVGQIAKIRGCKVVGYAGADEKVEWLKRDLGFDHAFNYKKISAEESLKIGAPDGVDCFFDNVGNADSVAVIGAMNEGGRIACCGAIATYNDGKQPMVPATTWAMVVKQLRMEGFNATKRWADRWEEGILQMAEWVREGKVRAHETVVEGFESIPDAMAGLFTGTNTGKMIVKL